MKKINNFLAGIFCICLLSFSSNAFSQAKSNTLSPGSYKTIYEMLKDVPGLDVSTNNSTGRGSITVRGVSSLTKQGQPLFVVDGSVYGGDISSLNPQDIEGISVLKDAASGTAYGSQGMFGVIVITTKKGGGARSAVAVNNHEESVYTYFIDHKTPLKIFGMNDEVIIEGVINKQKDSSLVFMNRRKEILVPIKNIKRVAMLPQFP